MDTPIVTTTATTALTDTVDNTADKNKISTASTIQMTPIHPPSTPIGNGRKTGFTNSLDLISTKTPKPPKPRGISTSTMYRSRSRSIETAMIQNNRNKTKILTIRKFSHGNDRVHNGGGGASVEASSVPR